MNVSSWQHQRQRAEYVTTDGGDDRQSNRHVPRYHKHATIATHPRTMNAPVATNR